MRMLVALVAMLVAPALAGAAATDTVIKDPEGKTIGLVIDCNTCKTPTKGAQCVSGAEEGYREGEECGRCLLDSNYGTRLAYSQDLMITGRLKDEDGQPLKGKFVKLFMPNNWGFRTRTLEDGTFRLILGATLERKGKAIVYQVGDRTMPKDSKAPYYALYMMPDPYKPCGTGSARKPKDQ